MIVFSRNVIACRCGTDVPDEDLAAGAVARSITVEPGTEADLEHLDPEHHGPDHVEEMRQRLRSGDRFLVGRLRERIVHYFWLSSRRECSYPSLPGCTFTLAEDTGYGYDAWTHPSFRGEGIRRRTFLKELQILRSMGKRYEASFFVAYQLEGAIRSLGRAGIVVEPVWRITLEPDRSLLFEPLEPAPASMYPAPTARGRVLAVRLARGA